MQFLWKGKTYIVAGFLSPWGNALNLGTFLEACCFQINKIGNVDIFYDEKLLFDPQYLRLFYLGTFRRHKQWSDCGGLKGTRRLLSLQSAETQKSLHCSFFSSCNNSSVHSSGLVPINTKHSFDLRRFLANTSQTNFRKFQEVSNLEFRTLSPRIDKGEQRQGDLTYL